MVKKILLVLGIVVTLFAGVNTVAALNSSLLDAIAGLPLGDRIAFVAREVDRLKLKDELREACYLADALNDAAVFLNCQSDLESQFSCLDDYLSSPYKKLNYPSSALPLSCRNDLENPYGIKRLLVCLEGLPSPISSGLPDAASLINRLKEHLVIYASAKADCDRLTEEFNQKYGE